MRVSSRKRDGLLIRRSLVRVQVGEPEHQQYRKAQPLLLGFLRFWRCYLFACIVSSVWMMAS